MDKNIIPASRLKWPRLFGRISSWVTRKVGSPFVTIAAFLLIVVWALTGPIFHFSDSWQLVINTGTTIITFLMVFIIQQSQNRDMAAIHLKLNELIASNEKASNRLVDVEDLTEDELLVLKTFYVDLSERAEKEKDLYSSHSMDEAEENHIKKLRRTHREEKKTR
ncbi:MAG: low affinity iron permease family protein [Chitinophagaceae bacterium]|nr:low affinity iron permease family protein [Chitinophagaceae bacterium]